MGASVTIDRVNPKRTSCLVSMFDLFSDDMRRNPYPAYDHMRSVSPVVCLPPFGLWMIFDFDGVKRALVDHDTFSSDLSHAPGSGLTRSWTR